MGLAYLFLLFVSLKADVARSCQNLLNWKSLVEKEALIRYKQYRNLLSTLLNKSKQFFLIDFFKKTLKT